MDKKLKCLQVLYDQLVLIKYVQDHCQPEVNPHKMLIKQKKVIIKIFYLKNWNMKINQKLKNNSN